MYLNTRVIGLNRLLSTVYGVPITLSILLTELGFTEQQLDQLHRDHWEEIVASSIALLKDRLVPWSDNHRSYDVVCRRFGVESPKGRMDGSMVGESARQGRYDEIAEYCLRDTVATADLFRHLRGTLIPLLD